jgi:Phosphotransferase enzyme family
MCMVLGCRSRLVFRWPTPWSATWPSAATTRACGPRSRRCASFLAWARSLPIYAIGDTRVLKLYPAAFQEGYQVERRVLQAAPGRLPIPTPRLEHAGEFEGWGYLLMQRLHGQPLTTAWPHIPVAQRRRLAAQLGEALAALHAITAPELDALGPPDWDRFLARQRAGCVDRQRAAGVDRAWLEQIPAFLDSVTLDPGPRPVLLHTEVMREHLLVSPHPDGWSLSGLLDFEPAMRGAREYEFAAVGLFVSRGDAGIWSNCHHRLRDDDEVRPHAGPGLTALGGSAYFAAGNPVASAPPGIETTHVPLDDVEDIAFWRYLNDQRLNGTPLYFRPFLKRNRPLRNGRARCPSLMVSGHSGASDDGWGWLGRRRWRRPPVTWPGGPQAVASLVAGWVTVCRHSLSRLWVPHSSFHSAAQARMPRRKAAGALLLLDLAERRLDGLPAFGVAGLARFAGELGLHGGPQAVAAGR